MKRFGCILADPPWMYQNYTETKNGAAAGHYKGLSVEELCALPVACVAAKNSVLLLWCTWPQLEAGIAVLKAWGFEYKTGFPWVKMAAAGIPRIGTGFHVRGASEFVLVGVRGSCTPPTEKRQPGVIFNPIGKHSAKPDAQYTFAEAYPGPYLEMFHRPKDGLFPPREGWEFIGNEATGRDIRQDLALLIGGDP